MFNNWDASNGYVLLQIFFQHSLHFFFLFFIFFNADVFAIYMQFHMQAHYKELNRSQGKQWRVAQNCSHPQTNVGCGWIWSIINLFWYKFNNYLKSFYKHQFHCFSSISSFFFYFLFLFPLFIYLFFFQMKNVWVDLNMKKQLKPRKSLGFITGSCWTLLGAAIFNN